MSVIDTQDHYKVLGVGEDASEDEIETAYYKKVREHPPEKDSEGHERVQKAFDVLSNPVSRREYDNMREHGDEIEKLKEEAEDLLQGPRPQYDRAIKKLKKAIVLGPEIGLLRNQLGNAYLQNEQSEKALAQFEKAVELDEENSAYRINRGNALKELGRLRQAEKEYRSVWEEDKGYYAAARVLAAVLFEQEKVEEAHSVLDEAIWADDKLDFEDFFCYYDKLQLYVAEGKTDILEEELETVKSLPETEDDRKFAAYMLSETGQMLVEINVYGLAQEFMDAAVELDPDNSQLRAARDFVSENAEVEQSVEEVMEDSSIHDFVKHAVAIFYQQYMGIVDDQEAKEQINDLNSGIQNVMQVDPDNMQIKKSIRRVRSQYPKVFDLNEEAFETILSMPGATARVDDCPHCGEPVQFEKGMSGKGQCRNCNNEIQISGKEIQEPSAITMGGKFWLAVIVGTIIPPHIWGGLILIVALIVKASE